MKDNNIQDLEKIFVAGDSWLMDRGIITPLAHNNIVLNLYAATGVPYLEYFINPERKTLELILYQTRWKLLFSGPNKIHNISMKLLKEYLTDYDIKIKVNVYKKGMRND